MNVGLPEKKHIKTKTKHDFNQHQYDHIPVKTYDKKTLGTVLLIHRVPMQCKSRHSCPVCMLYQLYASNSQSSTWVLTIQLTDVQLWSPSLKWVKKQWWNIFCRIFQQLGGSREHV